MGQRGVAPDACMLGRDHHQLTRAGPPPADLPAAFPAGVAHVCYQPGAGGAPLPRTVVQAVVDMHARRLQARASLPRRRPQAASDSLLEAASWSGLTRARAAGARIEAAGCRGCGFPCLKPAVGAGAPQVQERLTRDVAAAVVAASGSPGVMVVVEAAHMCMVSRGVQKPGSSTCTTASLGAVPEATGQPPPS